MRHCHLFALKNGAVDTSVARKYPEYSLSRWLENPDSADRNRSTPSSYYPIVSELVLRRQIDDLGVRFDHK